MHLPLKQVVLILSLSILHCTEQKKILDPDLVIHRPVLRVEDVMTAAFLDYQISGQDQIARFSSTKLDLFSEEKGNNCAYSTKVTFGAADTTQAGLLPLLFFVEAEGNECHVFGRDILLLRFRKDDNEWHLTDTEIISTDDLWYLHEASVISMGTKSTAFLVKQAYGLMGNIREETQIIAYSEAGYRSVFKVLFFTYTGTDPANEQMIDCSQVIHCYGQEFSIQVQTCPRFFCDIVVKPQNSNEPDLYRFNQDSYQYSGQE